MQNASLDAEAEQATQPIDCAPKGQQIGTHCRNTREGICKTENLCGTEEREQATQVVDCAPACKKSRFESELWQSVLDHVALFHRRPPVVIDVDAYDDCDGCAPIDWSNVDFDKVIADKSKSEPIVIDDDIDWSIVDNLAFDQICQGSQ